MKVVALADFGSTFTKVTLVEKGTGRLLAHAQSATTARSDVMEGYLAALATARGAAGHVEISHTLAASSAGGGLRMAAVGLVPELTATAARQAALNAGAKLELVLAGSLDAASAVDLARVAPEILLFSGGTDGGQRARVIANAEVLAESDAAPHVVVACNQDIAGLVAGLFRRRGRRVEVVENVLPSISQLNIEPARQAIHRTFIEHVIQGKCLSRSNVFSASVVMSTPEAVLTATKVLASRTRAKGTAHEVVVVDVGGATTDVHSCSKDDHSGDTRPLLPLAPLRRTVEGDLGVRWSAPNVLAADRAWLEARAARQGVDQCELEQACAVRHLQPELVADDVEELAVDAGLAVSAIALALERHCGRLVIRSRGRDVITRTEDGPDLREAALVIGTGGVLAVRPDGTDLLREAVARLRGRSLAPHSPVVAIDRSYVLAAAGLLASHDPCGALSLMLSEIQEVRDAA